MTVTSVNTTTFLSDITIFLRDDLLTNITDPISASRPTNHKFVMTSYPQRGATYPLITIRNTNVSDIKRLGMQSELHWINIPMEVRVWARNVKEKDELSQQVINRLRDFELNTSGTVDAGAHDFRILSAVNVDEDGDGGVHSRIIEISYNFVLGA